MISMIDKKKIRRSRRGMMKIKRTLDMKMKGIMMNNRNKTMKKIMKENTTKMREKSLNGSNSYYNNRRTKSYNNRRSKMLLFKQNHN